MTMLRALSLGAGVQSTALLLLILDGEVEADCAIFADTQAEPAEVYRHLTRLRVRCGEAALPLHVVSAGDLGRAVREDGYRPIPLGQVNADGSEGKGRRQCTYQFKVRPIRRRLRELVGPRGAATVLMGISTDEWHRAKDSGLRWLTNEYPLLDRRWSRADCIAYLAEKGVEAPRSACVFCPYRTNAEWRSLTPAEWQEAVRTDEAVRDLPGGRRGYLHRSLIPLAQVDLRTPEERGQTNWLDECEGMCGV